jgi:hypothetical protein
MKISAQGLDHGGFLPQQLIDEKREVPFGHSQDDDLLSRVFLVLFPFRFRSIRGGG